MTIFPDIPFRAFLPAPLVFSGGFNPKTEWFRQAQNTHIFLENHPHILILISKRDIVNPK